MENHGASVVINHHIKDGKHRDYENWLLEIEPICRNFPGHMDWQIIRPIPNITYDYTVIIRFDTLSHLKHWMDSKERKNLIEKVRELFVKEDNFYIKSGLDFLFIPENQSTKIPVRWKQFMVTWSAIFPLSMVIPLLVLPVLQTLNVSQNHAINSLFVSGVIVLLMIYVIMPYYTRLIKKWLYS